MPNCIILATQRTGSTLLCSELSDLGGLGRPGEHLLDALDEKDAGSPLSQAQFVDCLAPGRDRDGNVGLKLMADYLPKLAMALGEPPELVAANPETACARMLRQLEDFLGPTSFFRIDRSDKFDQALSRYLAVSTGIYFRTSEGTTVTRGSTAARLDHAAMLEKFDIADLEAHVRDMARETAFLDLVIERLNRDVLWLTYEDLSSQRDASLKRCCRHARIRPPGRFAKPWMRKVVDKKVRDRFRGLAIEAWAKNQASGQKISALAERLLKGQTNDKQELMEIR